MPWSRTVSQFLLEDEDAFPSSVEEIAEVLGVDFLGKHPKRSGEVSREQVASQSFGNSAPSGVQARRSDAA